VSYYQLDPSALRQPSPISQKMKSTGEGFPTFLDDLLRVDRKAFGELERVFYARCPYYSVIEIGKRTITTADLDQRTFSAKDAFVLSFRTVHDELLPADSVSDGVMLTLAYLAIAYAPDPPKILLLEEPENGVHHAALKDIVGTLRELSEKKGVQVILTTHSPYLLDLVEPEDVRVFSKDDDGSVRAVKLSDLPDVEDMKKHFRSGEIWTSFEEAEIVRKAGGKK
jgi:hypothetical protein